MKVIGAVVLYAFLFALVVYGVCLLLATVWDIQHAIAQRRARNDL